MDARERKPGGVPHLVAGAVTNVSRGQEVVEDADVYLNTIVVNRHRPAPWATIGLGGYPKPTFG